MQRYILQKNLQRFRERLADGSEPSSRPILEALILNAERDLALFDSRQSGVRKPWERIAPEQIQAARAEMIALFRRTFAEAPVLAALIDPAPGLTIVEVNPTYERASGRRRDQVVGQPLFEAFPDNPEDPAANGVRNLYASLRAVAETGREQIMAPQRYDVQDPHQGWTPRYWRPVNSPLHDTAGRLIFVLHVVEEVPGENAATRAG